MVKRFFYYYYYKHKYGVNNTLGATHLQQTSQGYSVKHTTSRKTYLAQTPLFPGAQRGAEARLELELRCPREVLFPLPREPGLHLVHLGRKGKVNPKKAAELPWGT